MNKLSWIFVAASLVSLPLQAAIPPLLNYQGRVAVNGVDFDGTGQFKFALVNSAGTVTYWSNDGTSSAGGQPTAALALAVSKGLYAVLLGDATLVNMTALPTSVFDNADLRLRVWFNDGRNGFEWIAPDQRLAASPYALTADKASSAASFTGSLLGEVTGTQAATAIAATTVTGKALTGYVSAAGTISATDTLLSAINKLNGNDALKANLASPTFSGTVALPAGSSSAAPLQLATGTNLTTAVLGSVEFDGTNLYLTTNAASPTRKTVSLSDTGSSSQIALNSVVAAPAKPLLAWGSNSDGQTNVPTPLSNVVAVAAGDAHSLALLGNGTVQAWGDRSNLTRATIIPTALTGVTVTEIAAGVSHNLVRKSDGTLFAWGGGNTYGETTIPSGITTATKVAAGEHISLALLANGTVRVWGLNTNNTTTLPTTLTGVTVTAIAAGYAHCLALTAGGKVVAWGGDIAGETVVPAAASSGVVAIAAGAHHSLALKSDGTVVAWGWDTGLQVSGVPSNLTGVVKIAAGYSFSMALKADGTLVVWGNTGSPDSLSAIPADANQVTAIAAGGYHALALRANLIPAQVARLDQDNIFTGKVGIQRTPTTYELEVNGNAWKSTAGAWLSNSDRRIKTDIESITGALEKIDRVRLVDFRYNQDYLKTHPEIEDRRYPNVIAQEFAQVFPDEVKSSGQKLPDGSEILQVDTYPLTIYSAAAVQELHRENAALQQQVARQERQLADQEKRLRKLEAALAK